MMDSQELARLLKSAGEDPNYFIGTASKPNPDGTVTVTGQGKSVRAIAQTTFRSGYWSAKRVANTWYAWSENAPIEQSSSHRQQRKRPSEKLKTNVNTVFLLDSNLGGMDSSVENEQGNIDFLINIMQLLRVDKYKKLYTVEFSPFPTGGTFFGYPIYSTIGATYAMPFGSVPFTPFLNQYVLTPLAIELIIIPESSLSSVDAPFWMPLLQPDLDVSFSTDQVSLLRSIAKNYGLILAGEHGNLFLGFPGISWAKNNTFYLRTFYNNNSFTFQDIGYSKDWVGYDKKKRTTIVKTSRTHGIPVNELKSKKHVLAAFTNEGTKYAGAIAWEIK